MNIIESIILGLIQGITEFLPISSSGHLIIVRELLNIPLAGSLSIDIFLNTATLLAVIVCFWGDIKRIFIDLTTEGFSARSKNLVLCLIIGTIPAAIIGYKFGDQIENSFRTSHSVAWALIAGSVIMFIADRVNKIYGGKGGLSVLKSFVIGIFQSLALVPGISRSGASISGGLLSKLSREEAIRFSFLLLIPVSLGALLKIFTASSVSTIVYELLSVNSLIAFFVAFFSGLFCLRFLIRYLSNHSFTPFIIYRIVLAIIILIFL